jgi:mRNA interferase RelE/StbE
MNGPVFRDRSTATLEGEVILYTGAAEAQSDLKDVWWPPLPQMAVRQQPSPADGNYDSKRYAPDPRNRYAPDRPTPNDEFLPARAWLIGFARPFRKAVESIDRKLQGRILEAMTDIASAPVTNRGDTIKRLGGDMDGFWRYRIGDFRLVYYPDEATRTITLYDFASRGGVYD